MNLSNDRAALVGDNSGLYDFDGTLERLGGDRDLFAELVSFFVEDSLTLQNRLREAVEHGDVKEVERAAHAIKGLCLNFGAARAADSALTIEEYARAGKLAEAARFVPQLFDAVEALGRALRAGQSS